MNKEDKKGFFSSWGESIDKSFEKGRIDIRNGSKNISLGLSMIRDEILRKENNEMPNGTPIKAIIDILMERFNNIVLPVGSDFNYQTILRWVKSNAIGNRFILLKYDPEKSGVSYIFVFFGRDHNVMLSESDPLVCFVCKHIPDSIDSKFGSKQVFIQPFE